MKPTASYIIVLFHCLLAFLPMRTFSQAVINGTVVDAISRQPLEYVTVVDSKNPSFRTITDQFGNFTLKQTAGEREISASYLGYKTITITINHQHNTRIELQPDIMNLKDVVVLQNNTATKFSTLSRIDLDLNPVRNTQELMRLVPGLFIAQHAGGGKAEQIFLRGFDVDHGTDVQITVDGMPVNMVSHAHGQGYADAHFIIPETINNIDFGAGPYYTQHGNLNTAGYVSFSTFNNISNSRIQVEGGRFNTIRTLAMIDLLKKNKDIQSAYIAGDIYYTDGPTINKQHFNRVNLFGKYNRALTDRTQLTFSASFFKSNWDASGQVPERAVDAGIINRFGSIDPTEGGNTGRQNANLVLVHRFNNGMVWDNQAFYSHNQFSLYSNFTFFANDPVNGDEINQAENRDIIGYNSRLNQQYVFNGWTLKSTYGAGLRYDATKNSRLSTAVARKFLADIKLGDIKEANAFGYVQQQISSGKWLIDAGVRFDYLHFDYFDHLSATQNGAQEKSILSPKLNIQYTVNPNLQLYIKSGKGFHSNDTRVVTANSGREILPAAYGSDIGIIVKPTHRLLLNAAIWYLHLNQEFVYVGDDGNVEPSGKTRREGIDLVARYQFSKNIFANVNMNVTRGRAIGEPKDADYIPLAPRFTSTGGLFYKAAKGLNGGLTYRYIKSRPADETNTVVAKGYFLMDASINYTTPKFEIGIAAENLFDVKWNEAQFATTSRLMNEPDAITELNFTPGTPIFGRLKLAFFF